MCIPYVSYKVLYLRLKFNKCVLFIFQIFSPQTLVFIYLVLLSFPTPGPVNTRSWEKIFLYDILRGKKYITAGIEPGVYNLEPPPLSTN